MKLVVRWLLLAAALLLVASVYSGVAVANFGSAMLAAFVLGLLNTLVRPLLIVLTFPVTLVTLGLFLFVINAAMFWAAARLLDGFSVEPASGPARPAIELPPPDANPARFFPPSQGIVADGRLKRWVTVDGTDGFVPSELTYQDGAESLTVRIPDAWI